MPERPLCPYCYRPSCPWLLAYIDERCHRDGVYPAPDVPPADCCPLYDAPLSPATRRRLVGDLNRGR